MGNSLEKLFDYLCDIVYDTDRATLNLEDIDGEHQLLGKGLMQLQSMLKEQREFALALSRGNLSIDPPPSENELASPLKSLHASLRHLSWQSQQVASGDYKQIVNFMGEFSDAFNTMTEQLDKRQKALEKEIESGRRKTAALEQSNDILAHIMLNSAQMVLLFDEETGETVYSNNSAEEAIRSMPGFLRALASLAKDGDIDASGKAELSIPCDEEGRYFSVAAYRLFWEGRASRAFVIQDITEEKENLEKLELYARMDVMTGVSNRRAGMEILSEWLEQKRAFVICFFDLDNLKYVNDTFGHDEGDRYIIDSSALISGAFEGGIPCRLGGDEFMLLAPGVTEEQAGNRITALCDEFQYANTQYQRRLSFGCVEVSPDDGRAAAQLLGIADSRMYEQKRKHKETRVV